MTSEPPANAELGMSWNGKAVRARGLGAVAAVAVLAIVAATLYSGWRVESAVSTLSRDKSAEHRTLKMSQDRTSCIVAMSAAERERFRSDYRPGAFRQWCPWVEE